LIRALFILFISLSTVCQAQFAGEGHRTLGADFLNGFIFQHKKAISHLLTDHPVGFRITYENRTVGKEIWQQRYNYPDIGMQLIYIDYKNPSLGKSIGIIPYFNIYFTKNKEARSQWKYHIGLGLGYNTNKYDKVENNKNNVLSTDINFGVSFQLQNQFRITDRLNLINSIAFTHFSNGAIKKPNSGINTISYNAGLSYVVSPYKGEYETLEEVKANKSFGYYTSLSFGMHEALKIGAGTYPFVVLSAGVDKGLNHKSRFSLNLDYFHSESLKREADYEKGQPNANRIGLALGHELMLGDVSLICQFGYYIYDPLAAFSTYYLRAGVRKYFKNSMFAALHVKSHAARAEAAEFTLEYRFK